MLYVDCMIHENFSTVHRGAKRMHFFSNNFNFFIFNIKKLC